MEIEEVAKKTPEAILRESIQPALGLQPFQARKLAFGLGLSGEFGPQAAPFFQALPALRGYRRLDAGNQPLRAYRDGRFASTPK